MVGVFSHPLNQCMELNWQFMFRTKTIGEMATEDLVVADLTGDSRPDIVAGGRATHNVKLYVNTSPKAGRSK